MLARATLVFQYSTTMSCYIFIFNVRYKINFINQSPSCLGLNIIFYSKLTAVANFNKLPSLFQ